MQMYIGEGFAGNGVNAAHINIMIGRAMVLSVRLSRPALPLPVRGITLLSSLSSRM